MANVDVSSFAHLRELFPELNQTQFRSAILYSMGLSVPEIAYFLGLSERHIGDSLMLVRKAFSSCTLNSVRAVVQIRLLLKCINTGDLKNG